MLQSRIEPASVRRFVDATGRFRGCSAVSIEPLAGDVSTRCYFRVESLGEPDDSQQSTYITQAQWIDDSRFLTWAPIVTDAFSTSGYRAIASLWSIDGELLERWIPPTEIVRIDPGPTSAPLAIHLG